MLPPSAIDAEGNEIPVSLSVSGDSITLHVEPQAEAAYPLLVDPVYESYTWMNSNNTTGIYSDWRAASSNEAILKPGWIGVWSETMHDGLNLRSYPGAVAPGSQANWNYYVPRFFGDYENPAVHERPTSYIRNMTLSQVYFLIEEGSPHPNPYMLVGLWDENKGEFASVATHNSSESPYNGVTINAPNPGEYTDVKNGGIALATPEAASYPRQTFVGSATVEVTDKDSPEFTSLLKGPSGWLNEAATTPISYSAVDKGLGVYSLQLNQGAQTGGFTAVTTSNQCLGTASNPCPREATGASRAIAYEPKSMPEGEDWVTITAKDPVGHHSPIEEVPVKVDHTAPKLSLSGSLTEQGTVGTHLTSYTLNYAAADGDETAPAAATPIGTTGTGTGQMERPFGVAVDKSGNVWIADRENNCVQEYSPSGTLIRQFGSKYGAPGSGNGQFSDPRGIAISSSGNVWVTDLGNKRVQEFNEKGEFIRSVTYEGGLLGAGKMAEPYAVATGPEETLWVGDVGSHRVYQFKENGTFVKAISSAGPLLQETSLTTPAGIAVNRYGDAYVSEQSSSQILELDPSGKYINKFGGVGAAEGQLSGPVGLSIASSGNIFVADANDNRIEEFKPDGTFLRAFGSLGSESKQLKEPRGLATGPENSLYVADAGNHRIAKWTHADKDPQSGVAKVEVKVDGTAAKSEAPGCSTRDCTLNGSWTMNADNYPAGHHKVEVITTDGVGLSTTKTLEVETHGDYAAPQVTLSGTMTEEAKLGNTRPTYKLKVSATDPGSAEERKSGVASITTRVDGTVVDSTAPGCPSEGCSLTREWTLTSSNYSPGNHNVEVITTDAAGHTTTKMLSLTIERDTTAPTLTTSADELATAPEGWVEQKHYYYLDQASDNNGYGVTSLQLKIDGKVIATSSGTCSAGSCTKTLFGEINMASYSGGEHPAELVATDGAGNVQKKGWAIRVDPSGTVSQAEGENTLEAVDETGSVNTIGEASPEANYEGTADGLGLHEAGESLEAIGSLTPSSIGPEGTLSVEIPSAETSGSCPNRLAEETMESLNASQEEELAATVACKPETSGSTEQALIEVVPPNRVAPPALTEEETAAVTPDASTEADLVTRPLMDGGMTFAAIRGPDAPEIFAFTVELEEGMELKLVDPQHAVVMYPDGVHHALSITAVEAHDAIGTTVPTTLSVSGNVIKLIVPHKAGAYVYPVVAGAGWEGGFETYAIEMPTGEEIEEHAEEEGALGAGEFPFNLKMLYEGPPVADASSGSDLSPAGLPRLKKEFRFTYCVPHNNPTDPILDGHGFDEWFNLGSRGERYTEEIEGKDLPRIISECHREDFEGIYWGVSTHGWFHFIREHWVWMYDNQIHCNHWGAEQPATVHCKALVSEPVQGNEHAVHGPLSVIGEYRFAEGKGKWVAELRAACFTEGSNLYPNPRNPKEPYERPMIWHNEYVIPKEQNCNWW